MTSSASATFNTVSKASTFKAYLVPAFNPCTGPIATHRPPLTLPACTPVASTDTNPANKVTFGAGGNMYVAMTRYSHDIKLKAYGCALQNNGANYTGNGLSVYMLMRWTDSGCGTTPFNDDCTMLDFPFPAAVSCVNGYCNNVKTTLNAILPNAIHSGDDTSIQLKDVSLVDPDGDVAASQGLFVP